MSNCCVESFPGAWYGKYVWTMSLYSSATHHVFLCINGSTLALVRKFDIHYNDASA